MNLFHRITATIGGRVDHLVAQVENHEAIAEASLAETRAASAKAKVRLMRVRKDGEALSARLHRLREEEARWAARAVQIAAADKAGALECVRRRNACRAQAEQAEQMIARHLPVEREVAASVERIEARLAELTGQRNLLRSRHSAADAMRAIGRLEGGAARDIDDLFDRWEMRIAATEYETGGTGSGDAFESAFLQSESEAGLGAELDALLAAHSTEEEK